MAAHLLHKNWVVNRHFTSRCDFCDKKNTVLQHCDAQGCHINICEVCMRSGLLAKDKKHKIGSEQAGRFEWQRRILPREDGSKAGASSAAAAQQQTRNTIPPPAEKQAEAGDRVLSVFQAPRVLAPTAYGPGPFYGGAMGLQTLPALPSLPLAFPSGQLYMGGQGYPFLPVPSFRTYPNLSGVPQDMAVPRWVAGPVQAPNEPEVQLKSSPKPVRKGSKRPVEVKSPPQAAKPKKRRRAVAKGAPTVKEPAGEGIVKSVPIVESRPKTPDRGWDESEEVISAANILTAMSRGGYAIDLLATPHPHKVGARLGAPMTPVGNEQSTFLPTPGSFVPGPKSKAKQVGIISPTPDEKVPWDPINDSVSITRAQWNERDERGEGLSARSQALRDVWERIMTILQHQFGLDDDEELFSAKADQFKLAWERMMACMPDMSDENRLNRTIAIAVMAEVEMLLKEALAAWKEGS